MSKSETTTWSCARCGLPATFDESCSCGCYWVSPAGAVDSAPGSEPGGQRFESSAGRQLEVIQGTIKKMRNDFGHTITDQFADALAHKIDRNLWVLANGRD